VELKNCKKCGEDKPLIKFPKQSKNPLKRSSPCFRCREKSRLSNPNSVISETILRRRGRYLSKPENVPAVIVRTSRKSDVKNGRLGFDLDRDFVADLLRDGCFYCGAKKGRLTVDRIDNSMAHTRANVKPACLRCNNIRGSMPYTAWVSIVPAIRRAYELGLFGDWWTDTKSLFKPSHTQAAFSLASSHIEPR
jgi:5-methylcytosine-specific restriction endonuclease McrA